jgi:hypothetical protein
MAGTNGGSTYRNHTYACGCRRQHGRLVFICRSHRKG